MTIQWTLVAVVMYAEIFILLLFMLPWIRAHHWQKLFNSRFVRAINRHLGNKVSFITYCFGFILFLLFADSFREQSKYSDRHMNLDLASPHVDTRIQMMMFRAQRNVYISGITFLLALVISRMASLISTEARLMASAEAAIKQAAGATRTAEALMKESEEREKEAGVGASDVVLKEVENLKKALKQAQADRDDSEARAEQLQKEFDELLASNEQKPQSEKKSD